MAENYPRTTLELERRFCDEEAYRRYLFVLRWPDGFVCPRCGAREVWEMGRRLWLCRACRRQVSVTAGTIFHRSHLSLPMWFRAMWRIANRKDGVSAMSLQRSLGLGRYRTAWTMLQEVRREMVRRDRLRGTVEVDETLLGQQGDGRYWPTDVQEGRCNRRCRVRRGGYRPHPTGMHRESE
jgi:transposase-like protein